MHKLHTIHGYRATTVTLDLMAMGDTLLGVKAEVFRRPSDLKIVPNNMWESELFVTNTTL
jgi:hypothetical protein